MFLFYTFSSLFFINFLNIKCDAESIEGLPDEESLDLEIVAEQRNTNKNNTNLPIETMPSLVYDPGAYCHKYRTCLECVNSMKYPCSWCHDFGCTHKAFKLCPKTARIMSELSANDNCPRILDKGPIVIPAGIRVNIKVKLHAPDPVIYDKELICQIRLKDRLTHLKGIILGGIVYCYPIFMENKHNQYPYDGTLQIIWGGASPLSNAIPISIYKCEAMGADCNVCKQIPIEYGCGWCQKIGMCVIGDKCSDNIISWTMSRITCDDSDKSDKALFYV